ncbi:MAG: hypothetical protein OEY24_00395 [Candidatus Bathyarchaeota archaeon]|nr:hypothetical protein [Candidatus Bathyarchaeota archaeon]MDH5494152.1 hypothetical protein [Candidatus Bathyarchaeota archaeon]
MRNIEIATKKGTRTIPVSIATIRTTSVPQFSLKSALIIRYAVEFVSLEVYRETKLLFWVECDDSSDHVFHGKLLTKSNDPVADQPIKAYFNETLLDLDLTTDGNGYFSFDRNFNPAEEKIYYTLQVSFEGTGSETATLNATDLMEVLISYNIAKGLSIWNLNSYQVEMSPANSPFSFMFYTAQNIYARFRTTAAKISADRPKHSQQIPEIFSI